MSADIFSRVLKVVEGIHFSIWKGASLEKGAVTDMQSVHCVSLLSLASAGLDNINHKQNGYTSKGQNCQFFFSFSF